MSNKKATIVSHSVNVIANVLRTINMGYNKNRSQCAKCYIKEFLDNKSVYQKHFTCAVVA